MNKETQKTMFSSKTGEWATPQEFFDKLNWRFGPFGAGEERPSSPAQNGPPAQLAGSHGALVTAGPRQLGTKAAGQAGSPRRAALVELFVAE